MKINALYVLVVLILSIAFAASEGMPTDESSKNASSFNKSKEFCCNCPDWTNLDAWLKKKKLCCDKGALLNVKCPSGCECLTEAEAIRRLEITSNQTYESCTKAICGCNSSGEPRYCFKGKSLSLSQ